MPETLFEIGEMGDSQSCGQSGQDVTVTRSHSDSHKKNVSMECVNIPDILSPEDMHKQKVCWRCHVI